MRKLAIGLVLIGTLAIIATNAHAQQSPQPTPETQALGNKLLVEINAGIQCSASTIVLKQQLDTANAQVKSLAKEFDDYKEKNPSPSASGGVKTAPQK